MPRGSTRFAFVVHPTADAGGEDGQLKVYDPSGFEAAGTKYGNRQEWIREFYDPEGLAVGDWRAAWIPDTAVNARVQYSARLLEMDLALVPIPEAAR